MPGAERHTKVLTNVWTHQVFKCLGYESESYEHKDASRHAEKFIRSQIVYQ